jgi:centrosomal protein CEP104
MPKLPFDISVCGGEDPDFPASALTLPHEAGVQGWQSPRFIEYPVELGLEFPSPVNVEQLQLLSHQSKITTKIEIAVGTGETYDDAEFRRLGSMSLDSNERSGYRARELKSVYLDATGRFLKLTFHKCFINKFNLYNQIGIVAVNVLGTALEDHLDGDADDLAAKMAPSLMTSLSMNTSATGQSMAKHMREQAAADAAGKYDDLAFDLAFDRATAEKIRSIVEAKNACAAREDFQGAKALKAVEQQLKAIGVQLAKMEGQKQTAVSREDYDAARSLRDQIKRLREGIDKQLGEIPAYVAAQRGGAAGAGAVS